MKLSWLTVIALVLLGVAAMLAYTWRDQDQKLRTGRWQRIELEVIRTQPRARGNIGSLLLVKWQDPADHTAKDGAALIANADASAEKYEAGRKVLGWVHPGFALLELSEAEPNLQPDQSFLAPAAGVCAALGLALLAYAVKSGRVLG